MLVRAIQATPYNILKHWGQVFNLGIVQKALIVNRHGTTTAHRIPRRRLSHHTARKREVDIGEIPKSRRIMNRPAMQTPFIDEIIGDKK